MMLRKLISASSLVLALTIVNSSCKKEDPEPQPKVTVDNSLEALLAGSKSKTWRLDSHFLNARDITPECLKDDSWTFFRVSREFTRKNDGVSCANGFPDEDSSAWTIDYYRDATTLTFLGGTYLIEILNKERLTLSFPLQNGDIYQDTFFVK